MKRLIKRIIHPARKDSVPAELMALPARYLQFKNQRISPEEFRNYFTAAVVNFFTPLKDSVKVLSFDPQTASQWKNLLDEQKIDLRQTLQLRFFLENSEEPLLDIPSPFKEKVEQELSNGRLQRVQAFSLHKDFYYLLLYSKESPRVAKRMELWREVLRNIQTVSGNSDGHSVPENRIRELESQLSVLKKQLQESERSLRKHVYELNNLLEISTELYSTLDFERLINTALLVIIGQMGCMRAFALLGEPLSEGYYKFYQKGFGKEKPELKLELDHPIINFFESNPHPVTVSNLETRNDLQSIASVLKESGIEIVAPILYESRFHGMMGCGMKLDETAPLDSDLRMFNILENMISISLSNAEMYERVKQMSLTDGMTSLNNYRYFESRLREEIQRSRRNKSSVSLIMLDIDHFKNYNDKLGHQAGDEALRKIGKLLKQTIREVDVANRYGGEEFSIILPGMKKESIAILAERIRIAVEKETFFKEELQPSGKITVSLGGASFPDDADSFEELVSAADQALYLSKSGGRNRFTLFQ